MKRKNTSTTDHGGEGTSELAAFLGRGLVTVLGGLGPVHVWGPWTGRRPTDGREGKRFDPVLYDEDHAHSHAELCLMLEGRCRFSFDHQACALATGDLVICPAETAHAEAYLKSSVGYRLMWLSLSPRDPRLHVTRYSHADGFVIEHVMDLALLPAEVGQRLQLLRRLAAAPQPPDVDRLREALLTIALTLYRRLLEEGDARLDTRARLVEQAIDFVREAEGGPLSLAEVARAVQVSPNYLTVLFRTVTGTPLGRFIMAERMARAQQALRRPGASVKAVAADLGFSDPFSFSHAFKRATGCAPRVWMLRRETPPSVTSNMVS